MLRTFLIAALFWATGVHAFDVPPLAGHVNDTAGVMSADARARLEVELQRIAREHKIEVAVLTVKTLGGDAPDAVAQKVFDTWKMGKKGEDRGLLMLVATQDRKVRLQPGYGLEGDLPDGKLGRILDEQVLPEFRRGDWSAGIQAGLRASLAEAKVSLRATGLSERPARSRQRRGEPELSPMGTLMLLGFLLFIGVGCAVSPGMRFLVMHLLLSSSMGGRGRGGDGGDSGGGFGGFGGGSSGGGGASRDW